MRGISMVLSNSEVVQYFFHIIRLLTQIGVFGLQGFLYQYKHKTRTKQSSGIIPQGPLVCLCSVSPNRHEAVEVFRSDCRETGIPGTVLFLATVQGGYGHESYRVSSKSKDRRITREFLARHSRNQGSSSHVLIPRARARARNRNRNRSLLQAPSNPITRRPELG